MYKYLKTSLQKSPQSSPLIPYSSSSPWLGHTRLMCIALQCSAAHSTSQCSALGYSAVQCSSVQCISFVCSIVYCSAVPYSAAVQCRISKSELQIKYLLPRPDLINLIGWVLSRLLILSKHTALTFNLINQQKITQNSIYIC